jgi:hypothetical protein
MSGYGRGNLGNAGCPVLLVGGIGSDVIRAPKGERQALRNLPEGEITAIGRNGRMTGLVAFAP